MNNELIGIKYLIASLPHSGTRYMVDVLNDLGSRAIHEKRVYDPTIHDGVVSGVHFNEDEYGDFDIVIHLVRNPLSWLGTQIRRNSHVWTKGMYAKGHYKPLGPLIEADNISVHDGKVKLLMLWLRANEYIENKMKPVFRFRIEDVYKGQILMPELCEFLRLERGIIVTHYKSPQHGKTEERPWLLEETDWPNMNCYNHQLGLVREKAILYGYSL
jgi:hypothetical protein